MADQPKKEVRSIVVHFTDFTSVVLVKQTWPQNNANQVENFGREIAKEAKNYQSSVR